MKNKCDLSTIIAAEGAIRQNMCDFSTIIRVRGGNVEKCVRFFDHNSRQRSYLEKCV